MPKIKKNRMRYMNNPLSSSLFQISFNVASQFNIPKVARKELEMNIPNCIINNIVSYLPFNKESQKKY